MCRFIILAAFLFAVVFPLPANAYTIWHGPHGFVLQHPAENWPMHRSTGSPPAALRLWSEYYSAGAALWLPLTLPSYVAVDSIKVCYNSRYGHITRTSLVQMAAPPAGFEVFLNETAHGPGAGCFALYAGHIPVTEAGVMTLRLDLTFDPRQGTFDDFAIEIGAIGISVSTVPGEPGAIIEEAPAIPISSAAIGGTAPNPFSAATDIRYTLGSSGSTEVRIYDPSGRLVRSVLIGRQEPGEYRVSWDGRDASGQSAPSGTYFYDIIVDGKRLGAGKALIIR